MLREGGQLSNERENPVNKVRERGQLAREHGAPVNKDPRTRSNLSLNAEYKSAGTVKEVIPLRMWR